MAPLGLPALSPLGAGRGIGSGSYSVGLLGERFLSPKPWLGMKQNLHDFLITTAVKVSFLTMAMDFGEQLDD